MTFEEFWKENYEKGFGTSEPYYGIASYAFEKGQENCHCVHTDNSKVIEKLEKENTELKERINNQAESLKVTLLEEEKKVKRITELEKTCEDLAEAKEIIKKLVEGIRIISDPKVCLTDVDTFVSEAEKFLEDIDK